MDLASAYSAVRDLPDSALHKEMQQPSGLVPQYLVMGELADRQSIRGGQLNPKPPTIAQQMMARSIPQQPQGPVQGYSQGGIIGRLNPFIAQMKGMKNPDMASGLAQDAMNTANNGLMPMSEPGAAPELGQPYNLSSLSPMPAGNPAALDSGGLATLLRSAQ